MKTTLDLPDDLLAELKARAARAGRDVEEFAAHLLTDALRSTAEAPAANGAPAAPVDHAAPVTISTDPETGLPVIHSPPDAPIHSMTNDQVLALIQETQLEEDLERAGFPVRH
jgi:plasmid stability protein